jgi:abortive infection bacteriophage resistance protein
MSAVRAALDRAIAAAEFEEAEVRGKGAVPRSFGQRDTQDERVARASAAAVAVGEGDPNTGETQHEKWLRLHDEAFVRSREEFAKHFKRKYSGENPPIWIAAELWDFGAMSFLYSGMKKTDQTAVAKAFGVSSFDVMSSWLHCINVARNICAHHSRFWNRPNSVRPAWPSAAACPDLGHIERDTNAKARVYGLSCMCAHLLRMINPNSGWSNRFKDTVSEFPASKIVHIKSAGFPQDWEKANLWA